MEMKEKKKVLPVLLALLVVCSPLALIATTASNSSSANMVAEDINLIPRVDFKNHKMESVIAQVVNASEINLAEAQNIAKQSNILIINDRMRVVLILTNEKAELEDMNIEIERRYKNLVQALVPISEIKEIAKNHAVQYIRRPLRAYPLITSEGVSVINADKLHARGIKGEDVKIAVIDAGFKGYATNPEIPSVNIVEVTSFRADGDITGGGERHGTACAETVFDVAPNAKLYLFNFETGVEFANAVDYAISKHIDIISCSMGWVNAGGYDGTGFICDVVNNARDNGILFVVAAGNEAKRHYEGEYDDSDGDGWHEFSVSPKDEILALGTLPAGTPIALFLSWDDWPTSNQDYDLYLLVKTDTVWEIAAGSENLQTGTQPPTEAIIGETTVSAYWGVGIKKYSATKDVHFELYSFYNNFPEHNVKSSSLTIPADAAGAMAVGATYWSNDNLESFSSRGPTNDGRTKPDAVAPDGVSNSIYGNFYGTSASTPHTAGAAALLLSAKTTLTANDIQSLLESTAVDLGTSGKDNLYGAGRIDVWEAVVESDEPPYKPSNPYPPNNSTGVPIDANLSWTGGDPDPGDTVTYDVYFEAEDTTPDELVSDDQPGTTYNPGTLNYNTNYYWKIVATDRWGKSTTSDVWNFTTKNLNTPPNIPSNPLPENHATGVSVNTNLSWIGGDPDIGDTVTHDIYFGTCTSPPLVSDNQTETSYGPGVLNHSTKYYWKIIATDNHGASTSGPLWDFTTTEVPYPFALDTGASENPYPSIFGTHNGTIKPNQTINVSRLYTYPCSGTGGHTEYVKIWNSTWEVEARWEGYKGDWHNITFNESFKLVENENYNYTIRTGSYPQIIHVDEFNATGGEITCKRFTDANGKIYTNWIPAIRLGIQES